MLPVDAKAQTLENGTYKIPYEVKKVENRAHLLRMITFKNPQSSLYQTKRCTLKLLF